MPDVRPSELSKASQEYIKSLGDLQKDLEAQTGIMGKVFGAIGQFFTGAIPHLAKSVVSVFPLAWDYIKASFQDSVRYSFENQYAPIIKKMVDQGRISKELGDFITGATGSSAVAAPLISLVTALLVIMGDTAGVVKAVAEDSGQKVRSLVRNVLPDPSTAVRAMFLDPALEENVREILRRYGLNDERAEMMIATARNQLDPGTLQTLYLRGEIGEEELATRLRAIGYTDAAAAMLIKTWTVIPGPGDLIRMAVREAFSPEQVAALGLDEAFPAEVATWAAKVGLKAPWPQMYWRAHWVLPSAQMGFEMLHRGEITEAQLRGLLKALDYSPVWHERLMNIAYNIVTRVDARRLFSMGIWTEEQLRDGYRKMGYAPDDAESLTAWTKVEYAQGDKEVTRAQIEKAYTTHIIDRPEAASMLVELGWSKDRAEWILDIADFTSETAIRSETIQAIKDLYLSGLASPVEVRQRLGTEEVDPKYIEVLIERWNVSLRTQRKLPSKTDLDKFLKAGLIAEAEYREELARLGYSAVMADRYYKLNTKTEE